MVGPRGADHDRGRAGRRSLCMLTVWRDGTELDDGRRRGAVRRAPARVGRRAARSGCTSPAASPRRRAVAHGRTSRTDASSFHLGHPARTRRSDQGRLLDSAARWTPTKPARSSRTSARAVSRRSPPPPHARNWTPRRRSVLGRKTRFARPSARSARSITRTGASVGMLANEVRDALQAAVDERRAALEAADESRLLEADGVDVTLPGRRPRPGSLHPLTIVERRIVEVFTRMGYQVVEGPEIEDDWHNFEALEHPARPSRPDHEGLALRGHPRHVCCGPRRRRRRSARWRARTRRSTSCRPAASTARRRPTPRTCRSSIRSSASSWTRASRSPT